MKPATAYIPAPLMLDADKRAGFKVPSVDDRACGGVGSGAYQRRLRRH